MNAGSESIVLSVSKYDFTGDLVFVRCPSPSFDETISLVSESHPWQDCRCRTIAKRLRGRNGTCNAAEEKSLSTQE